MQVQIFHCLPGSEATCLPLDATSICVFPHQFLNGCVLFNSLDFINLNPFLYRNHVPGTNNSITLKYLTDIYSVTPIHSNPCTERQQRFSYNWASHDEKRSQELLCTLNLRNMDLNMCKWNNIHRQLAPQNYPHRICFDCQFQYSSEFSFPQQPLALSFLKLNWAPSVRSLKSHWSAKCLISSSNLPIWAPNNTGL